MEEKVMGVSIVDGGKFKVEFKPYFEDPRVWGIGLCDIARHLARCYGNLQHRHESEVLEEIVQLFHAELDKQTSPIEGSMFQ